MLPTQLCRDTSTGSCAQMIRWSVIRTFPLSGCPETPRSIAQSSTTWKIFQRPRSSSPVTRTPIITCFLSYVDNIYEHAEASRAYVMAQCYPKKRLIEVSFMDDGMTIPRSLETGTGTKYPAEGGHTAILDALQGKSAKAGGERGFGLRSSVRIANALGGEVLIVSGRGAVVAGPRGHRSVYSLTPPYGLDGTLVSIRLPESSKKINLYELVE